MFVMVMVLNDMLPAFPIFLNNCPRKIVEILFKKIYRVVPKAEINGQDQHKFKVYHNEEVTGIGETMKCF